MDIHAYNALDDQFRTALSHEQVELISNKSFEVIGFEIKEDFFLDAENRDLPSNPDSIDVLFNEVLAWDRGREIAETLRLDFFEKDEYYEMSRESIEKYTAFFKLKILQ